MHGDVPCISYSGRRSIGRSNRKEVLMCFEFEQEYLRQRAEEARREAEKARERAAPKPAPEKDKDVKQPDPVPA